MQGRFRYEDHEAESHVIGAQLLFGV